MKTYKMIGKKPLTLLNGREVRFGDTFQVEERFVPKAFLDMLEPVITIQIGKPNETGIKPINEPSKNISKVIIPKRKEEPEIEEKQPQNGHSKEEIIAKEKEKADAQLEKSTKVDDSWTINHVGSGWYEIINADKEVYTLPNGKTKMREATAKRELKAMLER